MKKQFELWSAILADALLIAIAVISVPCAVLSAYSVPFSLRPLIMAALLIGLVLAVWMRLPKYGFVAGIAYFGVLVPLLLFRWRAIRYGFALVRYAMLDLLAPDVPFLNAPEPIDPAMAGGMMQPEAVGWFTLLVMAIFGLSVAWSLIRSRMLILPAIVPVPMFMISLIYTDLPLAHWTVLLFVLYLGTCLVTGGMRVNDSPRYGSVTGIALLLLLLLAVLIRLISPPETYEPISFERRQEIVGERVQEIYDDVTNLMNNRAKRTEDLSDEEEWRRTDDTVLEAVTDDGGEQYLRAYSLGSYRENAWHSTSTYAGDWASMGALGSNVARVFGDDRQEMRVTAEHSEMFYVPYGFDPTGTELRESFLPANGTTEYEWTYRDALPPAGTVSDAEAAYVAWAGTAYAIEDPAEQEALRAYAASVGLTDTGDPYETALAVANHVRSNATYSTTPGRIPDGEDFVLYFLQQSRTGYCVHFASATTALLQAMDIPARYVFGYRFFTEPYVQKTVTDEMAHAWTEVYVPGVGWVPIESTAGADGWQEPDPVPDEPEATDAPSPEPTEEPTPTPEPTDEPVSGTEDEPTPEPTIAPVPSEPPTPTNPPEPEQDKPTDEPELPPLNLWWMLWLLVPIAVVGGFWGAGVWVRKRRADRFGQKNSREAVLAMYHYQKRLERHGAPKAPQADALAVEATFSNHTMTEGRKQMYAIVKASLQSLEAQPLWKRLIQKYILFLL